MAITQPLAQGRREPDSPNQTRSERTAPLPPTTARRKVQELPELGLAVGAPLARAASDSVLLAAAGRGDERAFELLVMRYAHAQFSFARYLAGNREDAEDLVQKARTVAWTKIPGAKIERFHPWMCQVLRNLAKELWRTRGARPTVPLIDGEGGTMDVIDVRQDLGAVDDSLYVRGVLGTLPDEQREALHMRCLEDLSFEEMGERLGITRQSAWERTQRALAAARGSAGDRADIDW